MKRFNILSSFWLKIIALITMTIDHVGLLLEMTSDGDLKLLQLSEYFRMIGRLSLPLFIFMIVEGVIYTRSYKKYALRLSIFALAISIVYIVLEYSSLRRYAVSLLRSGNAFLDLLMCSIVIWALRQEDKRKLLVILLSLTLSITSFVVKGIETSTTIQIYWFPCFLTMRYDWFAILLGVGFYYARTLADLYIKYTESKTGMDKEIWIMDNNYQILVNIIAACSLVVSGFVYYACWYLWPNGAFINVRVASIQLMAILSGAFLLLYNGKRGYNKAWFKYSCYLYYPLHIVILAIIYVSLTGGL